MNYTVPQGTWTSLETIMGDDFDNTKQYQIHVNDFNLGVLQIIDDNSDANARGAEMRSFSDVRSTSATIYLRGTAQEIDIWVEEVASA